ncbi:exportin-6-like [Rhopilema esculentum]|uniref:exportin-6-like n=1 Tax=Rhopilema esculentum TaxID=499914 RepID=UPI0031D28D74
MGTQEETLAALENLLDEFFAPATSNDRKRSIENALDSFSHQEGAWRQCIFFLLNSKNEYVHMYSLSVLEKLVNQQWFGMQPTDKQEIRQFTTQFLISNHKVCPMYIKKKMAKVYVNIGRLDWPQFFPDFYHNILQFLQNESTIVLGLSILQITSEEFISPREDLNTARKQELRTLLLEQSDTTLSRIMEILDAVTLKMKRNNACTPPPSPNNRSPFGSPCGSPTHNRSKSPLLGTTESPSISSNQWLPVSAIKQDLSVLQTLDLTSEEIVISSLSCINHFFSWMPLSSVLSPNIVSKFFLFAEYGCAGLSNGSSDHKCNEIGCLAMNCINELISKNYFPTEYESFLVKMFQQTFTLLQQLTKSPSGQDQAGILAKLDENYLEKFTEFLSLFVSIHLKRFEPNNHFPTAELLSLLVKYTLLQPTVNGFFRGLEIWSTFLDYLLDKVGSYKETNGVKNNVREKYSAILMELLEKLLLKLQLRYNDVQLDELDEDVAENEVESERARFIRECLEVVSKIAEIFPDEVVVKIMEVLQPNLDIYFGLASHVSDHSLSARRLDITSEAEIQNLHKCLKDIGTFLQAMGRLAHLFVGDENFNRKLQDGQVIFERICQLVLFGTYYKLFSIKNAQPDIITKDFVNVHAHGLSCLQAFSHWLELFNLESKRQNNDSADKFKSITVSVLEGTLPLLQSTIPLQILLAASHLLNSLTTSVRPQFFLALEIVQKFYGTMNAGGLEALPLNIQVLISCALSNTFVLTWPLVPQENQEWEMRSSYHKSLVSMFTREYQHLPEIRVLSSNFEERNRCKDFIKRICCILSGIVETVSDQGTKSKTIVQQSTQDAIQIAADLFPVYLTQTDVAEQILSLLLVTVKSLKIQVGVSFVQNIIQQLLGLLTREQITKIVEENNDAGYRVIEKFMKMLEFVVQEHESSFKKLIPSIIEFVLHQVMPIIRKFPAPDINIMVLELLHQLLIHNWRFFFKSNVVSKMSGEDSMEHEDLFMLIIKEIGQALMENDILMFKKSLEIMQSLNEKYKLYTKHVFQANLLSTFLQVLLDSLVNQSHDLLKEDIIITIHTMASVDLRAFNSEFMQHYLLRCQGITDHQKSDMLKAFQNQEDLPSFITALQRFFSDFRYYQLINSSIPNSPLRL